MDLPRYYFRTRETGAFVFRIEPAGRDGRLEMDQIAVVNIRNGEVRANGARTLDDADRTAIAEWIEARRRVLAHRQADDILRTVDRLHEVTHWAQSKAAPEEIEAVTDPLLLAMHDLRQVLVRKRAERTAPAPAPATRGKDGA